MPRAFEQRYTQLAFQLPDLTGQRRLRDTEFRGRAQHAAFIGNGREVSEVSKLHLLVL
jgi:hypothetical protein